MAFMDRFKSKWAKTPSAAKAPEVGIEKKNVGEKDKDVKKAKVEKKEKKSGNTSKKKIQASYAVLIKPLVTEKSAILASIGKYVFVVDSDASRIQVAQAVEAKYGIYPSSTNIQNIAGKYVRFGRYFGKKKAWKKAIVTLPKGKTIDVNEGV